MLRKRMPDAFGVALQFVRTDPKYCRLDWIDYWGLVLRSGPGSQWFPPVWCDLEDDIRRCVYQRCSIFPPDQFVRNVISALECICRDRQGWGAAA